VVGISQNEAGVTGISSTSIGVFATSTTGTCIKAYSGQYTEEPQVLIEANNTQPGAFARLRMEQTNTDARWDIAVGGATNVMNFDDINFGRTILSLSTNGDATLSGSLLQHSSRALKDQIHDLACEEAVDALQLLNPVKFTLKSDKEARRRLGFISEEVPDLVASPDRTTVSPMDIIAVLTKVAQAQQQTITALTYKVNDLQRRLA
jgi:hypothetical protein